MIAADVDLTGLDRSIRELSAATGRDVHVEGKAQMRLVMRDVAKFTPPASASVTGVAARRRGEAAIAGDLFGGRDTDMGGFRVKTEGLFIVSSTDPNQFSSHVAEFRSQNNEPVFRKKEPGEDEIARLFTNKKGEVYGVEKQLFRPDASISEMLAHISRYRSKATGKVSRAGLRSKTIGRHVFIDKMVISPAAKKRLLTHLNKNVGLLAGNWAPGARAVGAPLPGYVGRHKGAHGSGHLSNPSSPDFSFQATNVIGYGNAGNTLRRMIRTAVAIRTNTLKRRIPIVVVKRAKKAGFG